MCLYSLSSNCNGKSQVWVCVINHEYKLLQAHTQLNLMELRENAVVAAINLNTLVCVCRCCVLQADTEELKLAWINAVQGCIDMAYRDQVANQNTQVHKQTHHLGPSTLM